MTDLTTSRPAVEPATSTTNTASAVPTPTLITEQRVLFATAAVVTPATSRPLGALQAAARAARAAFAWAHVPATPKRYPQHQFWLEGALMAREMHRL